MVLDPAMDKTVAMSPQLVHGIYEFDVDQPALVSVFQRSLEQSSVNVVDALPRIQESDGDENPLTGAGRGSFHHSNFEVTLEDGAFLDSTNGVRQLIIADGRRDPWIKGSDSIAHNREVLDKGNYGVIYRVRIPYRTSDGRGLALLTYNAHSLRSGCGQMAMALRVSAGEFSKGIVAVPGERVSFGGRGQMVLIQRFPPLAAGATGTLEVEYSPPGASCLPTPLVFAPYRP